ncbi:hypothetical protein LCGC14_2397260 [marine sediment metagenome]|uniref:PD-(D/E)XK endonuclease-like domain-containing protein n=1 Tax=marine sediment metagenome TaxID=412755 RepID=A0A0F9BWG6_9ZZZZ
MSQYQVVASRGFLIVVLAMASSVVAGEPIMQLELQTRNPQTSEVIVKTEKVDPAKVAVVIVDPWNYHWCMTWTQQAGGMTERMNRALEGARKLGMTVFWGPTDVASQYVGTPQRERALAVPYIEVPHVRDITCKFTVPYGPCLCGPGISCAVNYGEELMDPRLVIAEDHILAVDFKTNRVVPNAPDACPDGLLRQMGAYAHMLRQIYPQRRIETAVLWTAKPALMVLPNEIVTNAMRALPYLDASAPRS